MSFLERTTWVLIYEFAVQGHAGNFVFGLIGAQKTPVALLVGRAQSVNLTLTFTMIEHSC